MNKFILALALFVAVSATVVRDEIDMFNFMKFVKQHNKEYSSYEEFHHKFEVFRQNLNKVENTESYSPFMDISEDEFSSRLNLDAASIAEARSKMTRYTPKLTLRDLPSSYDAREHGLVSHVKNQGQCGSCWAFSAIANIEGQQSKKAGKITTLSEQQLVDCDTVDQGCNGGLMDNAFEFLIKEGGVESDSDYPYTGRHGTCKFSKTKVVAKIKDFKDISQNEDEIAAVLVENGPLSVAVNANTFQFYTGGILKPTTKSCNPAGLNHGVTLVGFGEEGGIKYWIIKNSWGQTWGEQGYIRLQRGTGACGVNTNVSTAHLE